MNLDFPVYGNTFWSAIRTLTQQLNTLVNPLFDECSLKLNEEFTEYEGLHRMIEALSNS